MALKLSKRDRYALFLGAGVVFLFVLVQFLVLPVMEKQKRLHRILAAKTESLAKMQALKAEYDSALKKAAVSKERFVQRAKDFTLFSFLDALAGETGLKDKIIYMKPSTILAKDKSHKTSVVEMKLQGIDLKQLSTYLYRIETSRNMVFIKRLSISKSDKEKSVISAILNAETYEI